MFFSKLITHLRWRFIYLKNISVPQFYYSILLNKYIYSGPFLGMKYLRASTGSVILPKLIGTYEDELHFVFNEIRVSNYDQFIDVGAAEGYYAVGLGKFIFNNRISVIAYETSIKGQKQIKALSILNSFNNIIVKGTCDLISLRKDISTKKSFLLMDVEGAEYYLLNPDIIDFTKCDILVEVHERPLQQLEKILINRFKLTHSIKVIKPQTKKIPENCIFPNWVYKNSKYVTNEFRSQQSWLWLVSRI